MSFQLLDPPYCSQFCCDRSLSADGTRGPVKRERQDPHFPSLFKGGDFTLRVRPVVLFQRHRLCRSWLDQPAVGVLQVSVELIVLVQGLRCPKRQLAQERRRVGGGLGHGPEADLLLREVELIADEVVKLVLVAHAVVQHLQGLQAGRVFAHCACQVPHLFVVYKKNNP